MILFERPAETMRWYLWHGKVMTAATILKVLQIDCDRLRAETRELREAAKRVKARCQDLYSYLSNNFDALSDYGCRYRNDFAVSSSRAEGCVDDIGNTRMGKSRRMKWSPQGAHRVAVTRAADLDGRLTVAKLAALPPCFAHSRRPHLITKPRSQSPLNNGRQPQELLADSPGCFWERSRFVQDARQFTILAAGQRPAAQIVGPSEKIVASG